MSGSRLRAAEWADLLLDGSPDELFTDVRPHPVSGDPLEWPGYAEARAAAPGEAAVRVWRGVVGGSGCVLIAFDFSYLGGSMSATVGARISRAFRLAKRARLPVVSVVSSGGSRLQEGMVALSQMARTIAAASAHARAGFAHIGVAGDPTTGGVYASFLSQADVLFAVAGAYVGFAGPRVAATLGAGPPPAGTNSAEWGFTHGLVDAVVPLEGLRGALGGALGVLASADGVAGAAVGPTEGTAMPLPASEKREAGGAQAGSAWGTVLAVRSEARPRAADLVGLLGDVVTLRGDRAGGVDDGVLCCLARLGSERIAVVGLNRQQVQPAGYRTAWRLFAFAERLGVPVVTLIDTPGADPGPDAEAGGQAYSISSTLRRLFELRVPTVAVVTGEGGSGGAMALAVADRLYIQDGAIFSVIAPEGAAAILHRDAGRAPEVAEQLRLRARDLVDLGIAHAVIPDAPEQVWVWVAQAMEELRGVPTNERLRGRLRHWGAAGERFVTGRGA